MIREKETFGCILNPSRFFKWSPIPYIPCVQRRHKYDLPYCPSCLAYTLCASTSSSLFHCPRHHPSCRTRKIWGAITCSWSKLWSVISHYSSHNITAAPPHSPFLFFRLISPQTADQVEKAAIWGALVSHTVPIPSYNELCVEWRDREWLYSSPFL